MAHLSPSSAQLDYLSSLGMTFSPASASGSTGAIGQTRPRPKPLPRGTKVFEHARAGGRHGNWVHHNSAILLCVFLCLSTTIVNAGGFQYSLNDHTGWPDLFPYSLAIAIAACVVFAASTQHWLQHNIGQDQSQIASAAELGDNASETPSQNTEHSPTGSFNFNYAACAEQSFSARSLIKKWSATKMIQLAAIARSNCHWSAKPGSAWQVGAATHCGTGITKNEDSILVGWNIIDGYDILCIGDGCGAKPLGQEASSIAVVSAFLYAANRLQYRPDIPREFIVLKSIFFAQRQLARETYRRQLQEEGSFRTTLIVIVSDRNARKLHFAHIGDGGGILIDVRGEIQNFIIPQRLGGYVNLLGASLGPTMFGKPQFGSMERPSGSIILAGTDGIFDNCDPYFYLLALQECVRHAGNMQCCSDYIATVFSNASDSQGSICDDNLTIAMLGDGTPPMFPNNFWNSPPGIKTITPVTANAET